MIGFRCPNHRQLDSDLVEYIHLMNIRLLDNEIACGKTQQQRIDNRPPRAFSTAVEPRERGESLSKVGR